MKKLIKRLTAASVAILLTVAPMAAHAGHLKSSEPRGTTVPVADLVVKFLAIPEFEPTRYTKSNGGKFAPEEIEKGLLIGAEMKLGSGNPDGMMAPLTHSFQDITAIVDANRTTGEIVITYNGLTLRMQEGDLTAVLDNGTETTTLTIEDGTAPYFLLVEGQKTPDGEDYYACYLPVKFTANALGGTVTWDEQMHRLVMGFAFYYTDGAVEPEINGRAEYTTKKLENDSITWANISSIASSSNAQNIEALVDAGIMVVNEKYQNPDGGWGKTNKEYDLLHPDFERKFTKSYSTFDNGATHGQLKFLSRIIRASKDHPAAFASYSDELEKIEAGFWKGIAFMKESQNEMGGWPQYYPYGVGYFNLVTYNDNAMTSIMEFIYSLQNDTALLDQGLCDDLAWAREELALGTNEYLLEHNLTLPLLENVWEKALTCTLNAQVEIDGVKTGWAQQYDPDTLKPATGRAFELPSVCTSESIGVMTLLMNISEPSVEVTEAIESFVSWTEDIGITGYSIANVKDRTRELGQDRRYVYDGNTNKTYGRFYGLDSNGDSYESIPPTDGFYAIFSGRDSIAKLDHNVGGHERRSSYSFVQTDIEKKAKNAYLLWQKNLEEHESVSRRMQQAENATGKATDSNASHATSSNAEKSLGGYKK